MDPEFKRRKILTIAVPLAVMVVVALLFWRGNSHGNQPDPSARTSAPTPPAVPANSTNDFRRSSASTARLRAELDQALRERDPRKRSMEFGFILALLFKQNPEAALAYLRTMPQAEEYTEGLYMVLGALGQTEPHRALALANEMATTREQRLIYNILFDQFARRDIPSALSYLELVPPGEGRENAIRAMATAWADNDMASSLNWAEHLGETTERTAALEATLITLSSQDPRRALALAQQFLSGGALDRILRQRNPRLQFPHNHLTRVLLPQAVLKSER
jgi:hypothetical protein